MATVLRPEVSEKNEYWISKHRHYELKHFCLQYREWEKAYRDAGRCFTSELRMPKANYVADCTAEAAVHRVFLKDKMDMVSTAAHDANIELAEYIFKGVTEGLSYEHLRASFNVPCCKESYYEAYRRFFWLLDKARK